MQLITSNSSSELYKQSIRKSQPFSFLANEEFDSLIEDSKLYIYEKGEMISRPDEMPKGLFIIVKGNVRMLATHYDDQLPITLDIRGPGQLCGWISFLRGKPSDWLSAVDQAKIFVIRPEIFIDLLKNNREFGGYFDKMPSLYES